MHTLVVGAGAMGCLFAALLARAGNHVCLLVRTPEDAHALRSRGLVIEQGHSAVRDAPVRAISGIGEAGTPELIMLMVKSYDTQTAVRAVLPAVGGATVLLTLQNGIGNVERMAEHVPARQILGGTTAHGATKLGPGMVRHAGAGDTVIGCLHPDGLPLAHTVREAFERAGIAAAVTANLMGALWSKLIVNCGINALGALMNCANGEIVRSPWLRALMTQSAREAARVAAARGIELLHGDPAAVTERVCHATALNRCSMLQDIRMGRRTEIDAINGAVAGEGRRCGVATPVNTMLCALVSCLEGLGSGTRCRT